MISKVMLNISEVVLMLFERQECSNTSSAEEAFSISQSKTAEQRKRKNKHTRDYYKAKKWQHKEFECFCSNTNSYSDDMGQTDDQNSYKTTPASFSCSLSETENVNSFSTKKREKNRLYQANFRNKLFGVRKKEMLEKKRVNDKNVFQF